MSDAFNPATAKLAGDAAQPFDPKTAQPADDKAGGILPNFAAGFGEGVTGGLDLLDRAMNPARKVADIFNAWGGTENKIPVADQAMYNKLLGHLGMNPDDVAARTLPERIARYAGQGSTAILVPGGEAGALAAGSRALTGAVAGAAGGGAVEALPSSTPDWLKPVVGMFASLAAGIPFSMGVTAASKVPGQIKTASTLARAGASSDVAEEVAGDVLARNATDPKKVKDILTPGPLRDSSRPTSAVEGSEPTTFQTTGDMGLGALERSVATKNPELFRQREAEQNAARIAALGDVQSGANPGAVADFFRGQLRDLDVRTAANIEDRIDLARKSAARVGGEQTPEVMGQQMRDAVAGAEAKARVEERGLWKAVDPEGNLTGNVKDTSAKADSIVESMRKTEKPMEGEEAAIFKQAQALPDVAPVADLIALRSRVSTAIRDELTTAGRTPSYARLVTLRGAIQDNLAKTISDAVAAETPAAVAADGSITARIAQWQRGLEAQRDAFLEQRTAAAGGATSASAGGPPRGGAAAAPLAPGGEAPTFDVAAAGRLAAATAATKERAGTFGNGPVGQVLRQAGTANVYRVADGGVPAKFFHSGPTAFQDAQAFLGANRPSAGAAGPDRGMALMIDAAASSLRRAAMTEDGILDPRRVMLWQNKYQDALRALPEPVREQFMNARNAGQAVAEAQLVRTEAMNAFRQGQVGQMLGVTTPEEVTNIVGRTFASPQSATLMRGLVDAVKSDPDAVAGLRQAVADHIAKRFIGNTEVATSGQAGIKADAFQTFVKTNEPALRQVFGAANMDTIKAIAEDIRQAKRSQNAVRLPGGSNTAQDTAAIGKQSSLLTKLWVDAVGGVAGSWLGPAGALAGIVGAHSMQALRDAGIANVDQLVTKAMLDPVLARRLLDKAPAAAPLAAAQDLALARAIRRSIVPAVAVGANARKRNGAS